MESEKNGSLCVHVDNGDYPGFSFTKFRHFRQTGKKVKVHRRFYLTAFGFILLLLWGMSPLFAASFKIKTNGDFTAAGTTLSDVLAADTDGAAADFLRLRNTNPGEDGSPGAKFGGRGVWAKKREIAVTIPNDFSHTGANIGKIRRYGEKCTFVIDVIGNAKDDWSDLRLTDANGVQIPFRLIDYERPVDNQNTPVRLLFEADANPAPAADNSYWLYYANPDATSVEDLNLSQFYILNHDFEDGLNNWTLSPNGTGTGITSADGFTGLGANPHGTYPTLALETGISVIPSGYSGFKSNACLSMGFPENVPTGDYVAGSWRAYQQSITVPSTGTQVLTALRRFNSASFNTGWSTLMFIKAGTAGRDRRYYVAAGMSDWMESTVDFTTNVASRIAIVGLGMHTLSVGGQPTIRERRSQVDWVEIKPKYPLSLALSGEMAAGYTAAGTYISKIFDTGVANPVYDSLAWSANTTAPGTSVSFQVRTAATAAGISSAVWSAPITINGSSISNTGRYIQVQATLNTADTAVSPILSEIEIFYTMPVASFKVVAPATVAAGEYFDFSVTAVDGSNATVTSFVGLVNLSATSGTVEFPRGSHSFTLFDQGTAVFQARNPTAETFKISATSGAIASDSDSIQSNPLETATLVLQGFPATVTAGALFSGQIIARDRYGNTATGNNGQMLINTTDPAPGSFPVSVAMANGIADLNNCAFYTTPKQTLRVKGAASGITVSTDINVNVGAAARLRLSADPDQYQNVPFIMKVAVVDSYGNLNTAVNTTFTVNSSLGSVSIPNGNIVAGECQHSMALDTTGNQTVTANTPTALSGDLGISVHAEAPAELERFMIDAGYDQLAGVPFTLTIEARDDNEEVLTSYDGACRIIPSVGLSEPPMTTGYKFLDGFLAIPIVLTAADSNMILRVEDINDNSKLGLLVLNVRPSSLGGFEVDTPPAADAGATFTFTIRARDKQGNLLTNYTGTTIISHTATGGNVKIPAIYTFTAGDAGEKTFSGVNGASFTKAEQIKIQVEDSARTGISDFVNILPAANDPVIEVRPDVLSVDLGTSLSFNLYLKDRFDNALNGYTGTINFSYSDPTVTGPANYSFQDFENGFKRFLNEVTPANLGDFTITAVDVLSGNSNTTDVISVVSGETTNFAISPGSINLFAGQSFYYTVTASNSAGDINEQYNGAVRFATLDPLAQIPKDSTLVNGLGTFQASYFTAGAYTLNVFDTSQPSISGSMNVTVVASAARLLVIEPAVDTTTAGSAISYTVKVTDAFGNPANITGSVTVSSTDSKATSTTSPQTLNFANQASRTAAWTFTTAGTQKLRAAFTGLKAADSIPVKVNAAAANRITGDFPAYASSELTTPFIVRVVDIYNNLTPYTNTINVTSVALTSNYKTFQGGGYTFAPADSGLHTYYLRWDLGNPNENPTYAPANVRVTFTPNPLGSITNGAVSHDLRVDNPRSTVPEFPFLRSWLSPPDRQVTVAEPFKLTYRSLSIRETSYPVTSIVDISVSDGSIAVSRDGVNYGSSISISNESEVTFWAIVTRTGFLSVVATPHIAPAFTGTTGFLSHPGPVAKITIEADTPQKAGVKFPWTLEWWDACDNYARKAVEFISLSAAAAGLSELDPQRLLLSGHDGKFNQQENRQWLTDDFIVASSTTNLKVDYEKREISIKGLYDADFSEDLVMAPAGIWKVLRFGQDGVSGDVVQQYTTVGNHSFTVPDGVTSLEYLVVGGGGGGGGGGANGECGAGGGAGGVYAGTMAVTPGQIIAIAVGAGGTGVSGNTGNDGGDSSLGAIVAAGGGGGGRGNGTAGRPGASGGGGGGNTVATNPAGGTGIAGQGFNGGAGRGSTTANQRAGGGGGGAGAAGNPSPSNGNGGGGGTGIQSNITGVNLWYAGGGGGSGATPGTGGSGVGGNGGNNSAGGAGTANRGGGGGGGSRTAAPNRAGGSGGSGVVILKFTPYLPDPSFVVENGQLRIWTLGDGSICNLPCNTGTTNDRWQENADDSYYYLYFDWPANDIFAFNATLAIRRMWFDTQLNYSLCHAGITMKDDSHATQPRFVSSMLRRVDGSYTNNRDIGVFSAQSVYRNAPNNLRYRRKFGTSPTTVTTHPLSVGIWRDAHAGANPGRFRPMGCHDGQSWREFSGSNGSSPVPQPNVAATVYTKLGITVGANSLSRPGMAWIDDFKVNRYPVSGEFISVVYDIGTSSVTLTNPMVVAGEANTGTIALYMRGSNNAATIGAQAWTALPLTLTAGEYRANPTAFNNRRYLQYRLVLNAHLIGSRGGQDFYDATPVVRSVKLDYTPANQGAMFAERNVDPPATIVASYLPTITAETDVAILGGTVASLEITAPVEVTAGVPFTFTVKALDAYGNIADDYDKTWSFLTSDDEPFAGLVPGAYTLVPAADGGQHTFFNAGILFNGPTNTITVKDGTLSTVSAPITVKPGLLGAFAILALSPQAAGTIFPLSLTALDVYNNVKTDYSGDMTFTDTHSGGTAGYAPSILPAASWSTGLANLLPGSFFTKAEVVKITGQSSYRSGTSNDIAITSAPPAALLLSVSTTSPDSGIPFSATVTILDIYGNVANDYAGWVRFSVNDTHPDVILPADYHFVAADAGRKTFVSAFRLITPGAATLQVVDTVNATMTHQFPLTVLPGPAKRFELSCSSIQTEGVPFNLIVKAYDDYGNLKTNFSETIGLSTDFTSVLPVSAGGFSQGQLLIPSVELKYSGAMPETKKITAAFGVVAGDKDITLLPPASDFARFDLETYPPEPTAGDSFKLVIKAVGLDGAVYTNYNGTGVFLEARDDLGQLVDPPMAPIQASGFTNGVKELYARNWVAGDITLWATDKVIPGKVGSLTVTFKPTNLSHFAVVPGTSTVEPFANNYYQTVNASFPLFLKAYDTIGNVKTDYSGIVQLSENGPGSLSSSTVVFVDGVATLSAVYYDQPGKIRITATDNIFDRSGYSGTLQFFGPLHRFDVAANTHQTDETPFPVQLTAIDIYGQEKLNFTGNVTSQRLSWSLGPLTDVTLTPAAPAVAWEEAKSYTWLTANRPDAGTSPGDFGFRIISSTLPDASGSAIISLHRTSASTVTGLAIETFSPQQAGKPFPMLVKAVDASGAVVKTWAAADAALSALATLGFNSDIIPATIAAADFVDGVYATTTAQIALPGTYTVSVSSVGLSGSFSPLLVKPGAASALRITVPDYAPLNANFAMSVAAVTADGQVKTDFIPDGPILLKLNATSTGYLGVQFINPEDFVDGEAKILNQTYNKSQEIFISAIDNVSGMRDIGGPIKVFGPPVKLVLQPLPDAAADFFWNNWLKVRVTIKDVNGYPVANFTGDIGFSVAPGTGSLAADAAILPALVTQLFEADSLGSQEFYLKVTYSTLQSPTLLDIAATNAVYGLSGNADDLRFLKEPRFDSFEILSPADGGTVYKGKPFNFRVRAVDNFGNPWPLLASYPGILVENVDPLSLSSFNALPSGHLEFLNTSEVLVPGKVEYDDQTSAIVRYSVVPEDNLLAGDFVEFKISTGFNLKDSIYQKIATETFALPSRYILSAFISPGTGSAELKFTLINANGDPESSFGARINSDGTLLPIGSVAYAGKSEVLLDPSIANPDHQKWYRVYLAFDYQFDQNLASDTIIHLQNSTPAGFTASTTAYFDGIQLEKAFFADQVAPTAYSGSGIQIFSPNPGRSISGENDYFEW
jgi:hypothetical protein